MKFTSLIEDYSRYLQSFETYLERSSEHQSMRIFIHGPLSDILTRVGEGKSILNVLGLGSGSGEIDVELLRLLHSKNPQAGVENEVVEPSGDMLEKYQDLVSKTPGLDHITFRWNKMTAFEFMSTWMNRKPEKKLDFIHMIQMLYYEKDLEATVSFYRSLLNKNGKLLIILDSGDSGLCRLWRTYQNQLSKRDINQCITMGDISSFLDIKGISYQSYRLPSQMDITECFIAGDMKGELLLDALTEVVDFSKSASPELKAGVLTLLKHPDCSQEVDGRIMLNSNLQALLLGP